MAHSMPKALGFSPGARSALGITVFTGTTFWREQKFGVAYMSAVTEPSGSTQIPSIEVSLTPRWTIERSLPSRVGAERQVWRVAGAPAKGGEGLRPRDCELHRPAQHLCRHGRDRAMASANALEPKPPPI